MNKFLALAFVALLLVGGLVAYTVSSPEPLTSTLSYVAYPKQSGIDDNRQPFWITFTYTEALNG